MTFSEETIRAAWSRADGRCECRRKTHDHPRVWCGEKLDFANRGRQDEGAWEAHHKLGGVSDALSNCEVLCWQCHKQTFPGPG